MTLILKIVIRALPLIILFVAATSLLSLRSCADGIGETTTSTSGSVNHADCVEAGNIVVDNPHTLWPLSGGANWGVITASFCDPSYLLNLGQIHYGLDLGYPPGHTVLASSGGTIDRAEYGHSLRGNNIALCHIDYCAIYMHLTTIDVTQGQVVFAGQTIGTVGSTGNSTGPHLHFEVRNPWGNAIDPAPSLN
jgi:murein DD-endopeptidase MepM/ murein hydrolase activator NlpD